MGFATRETTHARSPGVRIGPDRTRFPDQGRGESPGFLQVAQRAADLMNHAETKCDIPSANRAVSHANVVMGSGGSLRERECVT
jgi:hypothetical protein